MRVDSPNPLGAAGAPLVSVVIPTRNRKCKLARLLDSVYSSAYPEAQLEVLVVDNASSDGTAELVSHQYPRARVLQSGANRFVAAARNIGARSARGVLVFFVDDDNVLEPRCIGALAAAMMRSPNIGVSAPVMLEYGRPERIWCAGGVLDRWGRPRHRLQRRLLPSAGSAGVMTNMDYFPNAFMVRRELIARGLIHDDVCFPHNWTEQDLGKRVRRAGYQLATVPAALEWHDSGYRSVATRINLDTCYDQARSRIVFRHKYYNESSHWLFFWAVHFPVTSVYYMARFAQQEHTLKLMRAYLNGTLAGWRFREHSPC